MAKKNGSTLSKLLAALPKRGSRSHTDSGSFALAILYRVSVELRARRMALLHPSNDALCGPAASGRLATCHCPLLRTGSPAEFLRDGLHRLRWAGVP